MTDNRFKDFPIDARFPSPGVDFRFAELGVDARFRDGLDTRFQGDTYGAFNPARLFGPTDTGWVYDLYDRATLFEEAAGITPVTAVGQPVGMQLDKSGRGNHRSQSVSLNRPTYARHPLGGIRNLLTRTEEFDDPAWAKLAFGTGSVPVVTPNAAAAPDGTLTADQVVFNSGAGTTPSDQSILTQSVTTSAVNYNGSIYLRTLSGTATLVFRNAGNAGYGTVLVTDQWQRFDRSELGISGTGSRFEFGIRQGLFGIGTINSSATVIVWGAQLEPGSTATAYQRVGSVFDVTEAGQPDLYYLSYDGLNDSLSTAPFAWGTDKATVVAGVRKLSDAAGDRVIVEASANSDSTNGAFRLGTNAATFTWRSRGTVSADTSGAGAQPISAVLTGIGDISGDVARLRRTGVQVGEVLTDQGTGNFGTHQAFFGARNGASGFFRGWEYSNVGISRLLTTGELAALESWTAGKAGNTL